MILNNPNKPFVGKWNFRILINQLWYLCEVIGKTKNISRGSILRDSYSNYLSSVRSKDTEVNNIANAIGVSKINYNQVIIDPTSKHKFNIQSKSPYRGKKSKVTHGKNLAQYEISASKEEINSKSYIELNSQILFTLT